MLGCFPRRLSDKGGTSTGFTSLCFEVEKGDSVSGAVILPAVTNRMWEKLYALRTSIATMYYSPAILYVNMSYLSKMYVFNLKKNSFFII